MQEIDESEQEEIRIEAVAKALGYEYVPADSLLG